MALLHQVVNDFSRKLHVVSIDARNLLVFDVSPYNPDVIPFFGDLFDFVVREGDSNFPVFGFQVGGCSSTSMSFSNTSKARSSFVRSFSTRTSRHHR